MKAISSVVGIMHHPPPLAPVTSAPVPGSVVPTGGEESVDMAIKSASNVPFGSTGE